DVKEFLEFKIEKNKPTVELETGIQVKVNANLNQRFTLVMRFVHENVNGDTVYGNYYDTYHLCPPGSCVITS
ncbi:MAG TPA: hypothetical protein DIW37_09425, partial [Chryseobacterium sp.]|nr:hypothetical protein [Chryseobacterium sp.]